MAVVKNIIGGAIDFVADAVGGAFSIVAGIAGEIIGSLLDIPDVDSQAKDDQTLSVSSSPKSRMLVGESVVSGDIIKYYPGVENEIPHHYFYVNLATHPCESVELYQMEGETFLPLTGNG